MATIFLDEAGNTGPDLVSVEQPVFVLASSPIAGPEASDLLLKHFGRRQMAEIKYRQLARRERGQEQLSAFFAELASREPKPGYFATHKLFALLGFLVDFWLEPLMHRTGFNFYERGLNIAFLNVTHITLGACLGPEDLRELLRRFQVMTRDRTAFAYRSFWESMERAVEQHELIDRMLRPLLLARDELGPGHLFSLPKDLLDLGDYGVLESVNHWRTLFPDEQLEIVHDESKAIRRHAERWARLFDPTNAPASVGQDRRVIRFPIPVASIRSADSEALPELQIADLVAGAAAALLRSRLAEVRTTYTDRLEASGLLSMTLGGVWPTDDISPADLETDGPTLEDAADYLARRVFRRES